MTFADLTIVTSCFTYGEYLADWAASIAAQTVTPGRVCILTHGTLQDMACGHAAQAALQPLGILCHHKHVSERLDFGVARNRAVEMASSEWVMHLDADDLLFPDAVAELQRVAPTADVVQSGYRRIGPVMGMSTKQRLYEGGDGLAMLAKISIASGNSMFRRALWQVAPYRTDLLGAWDTCLWIGFARLGARFRPSTRPIFQYRQHSDSIFNTRRKTQGWARVHTSAMIKAMRRGYTGVAIIVPRDLRPSPERQANWMRVRRHYAQHHPSWSIIEGFCPTVTWSKGAAIQDALSRSDAEIIVIADADVLVEPEALESSVHVVQHGVPWSMPHRLVYRASEEMTRWYTEDSDTNFPALPDRHSVTRDPYEGFAGGGIVVLRHVDYNAMGGIPLSFLGWGHEDQALATLCTTLLGPCARGDADLLHLWHPPQTTAHEVTNLQLLRKLGMAAQQGRDVLVQTVQSMPKPSAGIYHYRPATSRTVTPINHAAIQARIERRAK